jgi:hypothetical protein
MQWFYTSNGTQTGPVSETELHQLAAGGVITPATLVWREGLAEWQPYAKFAPAPASPTAPPPLIDQGQCVECQRLFSRDDLLTYENVLVCAACKPTFFQKLKEGLTIGSVAGLWRAGKQLVMRKEAVLPDRCVKCDSAEGVTRLKRKLFWHAPWWYLLIFVSCLIYIIVAIIIQKRARIEIGLCTRHREKRKRDLIIAWAAVALGMVAFLSTAVLDTMAPIVVGILLVAAGLIYGLARTPMVSAKRIDEQFVWLNGVTPEYLARYPEWNGPR